MSLYPFITKADSLIVLLSTYKVLVTLSSFGLYYRCQKETRNKLLILQTISPSSYALIYFIYQHLTFQTKRYWLFCSNSHIKSQQRPSRVNLQLTLILLKGCKNHEDWDAKGLLDLHSSPWCHIQHFLTWKIKVWTVRRDKQLE